MEERLEFMLSLVSLNPEVLENHLCLAYQVLVINALSLSEQNTYFSFLQQLIDK